MLEMTNKQAIAEEDANAFWWRARACFTGIIDIFHNAGEDFEADDDEWVLHKMEDHKSLIALGRFVAVEAVTYLEGLKGAARLWERRARARGWKPQQDTPACSDEIQPDDYAEFALEAGFCVSSLGETAAQLYRLINNPDWQARLTDKAWGAGMASEVSDDAAFIRNYLDKMREAAEIWKGRAVEAGWPETSGPAFPVTEPGKTRGDVASERRRVAEALLDESLTRAARADSEPQAEEMSAGVRA
jgi:hypothetical protein